MKTARFTDDFEKFITTRAADSNLEAAIKPSLNRAHWFRCDHPRRSRRRLSLLRPRPADQVATMIDCRQKDGPMFVGGGMYTDQEISLLSHGDQLERETWTRLEPYLSKYEVVWQMQVVPLRAPGSIYLRAGIDPNLETFVMNNYTAYVNMTRALGKIESNADDLKFAEEIWANLQRAVEVACKAAKAYSEFYRDCTRKEAKINTEQLDNAEASVKIYRNRLHHPILATLKDENETRLVPKRDKIEKYNLWTKIMYECDFSDFVPVESQLRSDFSRVCSSLQDFWAQIEKLSLELLQTPEYQRRTPRAVLFDGETKYRIIDQDSSSAATSRLAESASGSFNVLDSSPSASDSLPSWFKSGDST